MFEAVEAALPADCAVFAAAVADWRVATPGREKIKKQKGTAPRRWRWSRTRTFSPPSRIARRSARPSSIGFAAETENVIANAKAKLNRKGCDWIVANDVSPETGIMGGETNSVHLVTADGVESWPSQSKDDVARALVARIAGALAGDQA